jgi:hypothetical protein
MLHGRFSGLGKGVPSWVIVDLVRMENGLLAEHWDVIQDEATRTQWIGDYIDSPVEDGCGGGGHENLSLARDAQVATDLAELCGGGDALDRHLVEADGLQGIIGRVENSLARSFATPSALCGGCGGRGGQLRYSGSFRDVSFYYTRHASSDFNRQESRDTRAKFPYSSPQLSPEQRAQCHTVRITNLRGDPIDTAFTGLQQMYSAFDAQILEVGQR